MVKAKPRYKVQGTKVVWSFLLLLCFSLCSASSDWSSRIQNFRTWFAQNGGRLHRNVRLDLSTGSDDSVRSVRYVTKGRIQKGHPVVTVPDALLIHVPDDWPRTLSANLEGLSKIEMLCLYLLHLRATGGDMWDPYVAMLPTTADDSALNLSTKVVAILNTTSSWRRIQHYQEASAAFEHKVRDSGLQVHWAQRPTDLHWAWVTVHSRSMKVFIPRNPNHPLHAKPFLAPGADFLNHEPAVQVEWQLRKGKSNESMLHIATQQAYPRAGLEVFNQYADLSNCQLFSTFGFTVKHNPHDSIHVHLPAPLMTPETTSLVPLHAGQNTHALIDAANAARSFLLVSMRSSLEAGAEGVTSRGVTAALMNSARILSLEERDLTEVGLTNLLALNSGSAAGSPPWSAHRIAESGVSALHGQGFSARFSRVVKTFFGRHSHLVAGSSSGGDIHTQVSNLALREARDLVVPPRVELAACNMLHAALHQLLAKLADPKSEQAAQLVLESLERSQPGLQPMEVTAFDEPGQTDWHSSHSAALSTVEEVLRLQTRVATRVPGDLQAAHALRIRLGEEAMLVRSIRQLEAIIQSGLLLKAQTLFEPFDVSDALGAKL